MPADPFVVNVARLRRALGTRWHEIRQGPFDPTGELAPASSVDSSVPEGADATCDVVLESYRGGVLVTGTVSAPWRGVCRRCTTPIDGEFNVSVKERFCDPDPERHVLDDELAYEIGDDQLDLGPMMRDAIVLELPLAPLCLADCAGLCAECGADRNVEACTCVPPVDPRWATLDVLRSSRDVDRPVEHAREGT